jgi:hypothetical protein
MLKAAEMNKVRSTQLQEKELLLKQEMQREMEQANESEELRAKAAERELEEMHKRHLLNIRSRQILQDQINERQLAKQQAFEAFLREKAIVDEIVRSIEMEDRAQAETAKARQRELQDNIIVFLEQRKAWRETEKKRAEEELQRIAEYNEEMTKRQAELLAGRRAKSAAKDELLEKLSADIEQKRREKEEMESLLEELYQEEAEARAIEQQQAKAAHQQRLREEMMEANEYQKMYKAQRALEQAGEEEDFRRKMMAKFADDDRVAQMNELRRRREMGEYKQEVERMIAERRRKFEESLEAELEELRRAQEEKNYRAAVVERERQRLLAEQASALKGYLPKGVLRSEADYERMFGAAPNASSNGRETEAQKAARRAREARQSNIKLRNA